MPKNLTTLAAAFIFAICSQTGGLADQMGDYVGYTACVACHEKVVEGWKTTPHAHAFEILKRQGKEKQALPGCIKCHVVAYEKDGGFVDMELTPELVDVQCEACHGPGRQHVETEDPMLISGTPDEALCRTCHTLGQDKNFNYMLKKQTVHGGKAMVALKAENSDGVGKQTLRVSQSRVDFGIMIEGGQVEKQVLLTNTSAKILTLINVTTS